MRIEVKVITEPDDNLEFPLAKTDFFELSMDDFFQDEVYYYFGEEHNIVVVYDWSEAYTTKSILRTDLLEDTSGPSE